MKLTPLLLFEGDRADATAFYQQCLGGDLTVTHVRDTPMGASAPAELRDKVAYAQLVNGDIEISATAHPDRSARR
jgi:PhnB protein